MFSIDDIKSICEKIVKDNEEYVNDSHTRAEHAGYQGAFDELLEELKVCKSSEYVGKHEIVLAENDLEDFKNVVYGNENITWLEHIEGVGKVDIEFISLDEYEQREA